MGLKRCCFQACVASRRLVLDDRKREANPCVSRFVVGLTPFNATRSWSSASYGSIGNVPARSYFSDGPMLVSHSFFGRLLRLEETCDC